MKALVLVGGMGTRLRPLTHTTNKHLLPIDNQPMIFRVISDLIDGGVTSMVINTNKGDEHMKQVIRGKGFPVEFHFVEQDEPNGIMYPLVLAKEHLQDDCFVMHAGDNVVCGGMKNYIETFHKNDADAHLLCTKVPDPERFGVAITDEDGHLLKTVEKPQKFVSDLAVTGIYFYKPSIYDAVAVMKPTDPQKRGKPEYFPPPVHQWMVDKGYRVTTQEITGWWKDTGKPQDLLEANRLALSHRQLWPRKSELINCHGTGNIAVDRETVIRNCKINGNVVIGKHCLIENCTFGDGVCIGDDCVLKDVHIENSILLTHVLIDQPNLRIHDALVGHRAVVTYAQTEPLSLFIGDNSIVTFGNGQ